MANYNIFNKGPMATEFKKDNLLNKQGWKTGQLNSKTEIYVSVCVYIYIYIYTHTPECSPHTIYRN